MWENMRTDPWGAKKTQEYYMEWFQTVDISRKIAKFRLDNNLPIADNIDMKRLRAIYKQLTQDT